MNDSQIGIQGGTPSGGGGSTVDLNLGRILVGASTPAAQSLTLNKAGVDGTYFQVTTAPGPPVRSRGDTTPFATERPIPGV